MASSSRWLKQNAKKSVASASVVNNEEQQELYEGLSSSSSQSQPQQNDNDLNAYKTIVCNNYNAVSYTLTEGSKTELGDAGAGEYLCKINIPTDLQNNESSDLEVTSDDCEIFYILPHHKCSVCNMVFSIVDHLNDHVYETHFKESPYKDQCLICGKLFDVQLSSSITSTLLDEHMRTDHLGINPYRCKYCARRFSTRSQLLNHSEHLHETLLRPYECDLCGRSFSVLTHLKNHKSEQHKKILNCPYCPKCFDITADLKLHLLVHINPEKTIDTILPDYDKKQNNLKSGNKNDQNYCIICNTFVEDITYLNDHLKTHNDLSFLECSNCNCIYENFDKFMEHINSHKNFKSQSIKRKTNNLGVEYVQKIHCGYTTRPSTPEPVTVENNENEHGESNKNNDNNKTVPNENENQILPSSEKICILCKKIFRNNQEYDKHIKNHSKSMILRNTGPLGTISWRNKLLKSYPYRCTFCKRYFVLGTTLLLHNKTVHKELKPHKCQLCLMQYAQSSELIKHYNNLHPDVKKFSCEVCDLKFKKKRNLRNHRNHHKGNIHYKCTICGSECSSIDALKIHRLKHIGEVKKDCPFCEVPYVNDVDLNIHVSRTHNVNLETWKCRLCQMRFNSADEIIQHNRQNHFGERPYKCDKCGKSFALLHSLVNHNVVHVGKKNFKCEYCDKKFSFIAYLKSHMKVHNGDRPYICSKCPKTFATREDLYKHKKQHFDDTPKPFTCEICGKSFITSTILNKHMYLHNGIKSFKCNLCPKAFVKKSHLDHHMFLHINVELFSCEVCQKKFKIPSSLIKHERHVHFIFKSKMEIQEIVKKSKIVVESNKNDMNIEDNSENENEDYNSDYDEDFEDYNDDEYEEDEAENNQDGIDITCYDVESELETTKINF